MVPGLNVSTTTSAPSHNRRNARPALLGLEVEHHRTPAAIPHVISRLGAEGVAAGWLDLYDIGAEFGQQQDADRSGHSPTEVEHPHALEWSHGLGELRWTMPFQRFAHVVLSFRQPRLPRLR